MAPFDYYEVLDLHRGATADDVQRAYRRKSLKTHPQRSSKAEAEEEFAAVAEAFDVLGDARRRALYDSAGAGGLGTYTFCADPFEMFAHFFGGESVYAALESTAADLHLKPRRAARVKEDDLMHELRVTFRELSVGGSRVVSVERYRCQAGVEGARLTSKTLQLDVQPSWASGARITFKGEGHQMHPSIAPGDCVFVVVESPAAGEEKVSRVGESDLEFVETVTLAQALRGDVVVAMDHVDGERLSVVAGAVDPSSVICVPGRGLGRPSGGGRGDLHIRFNIIFPKTLDREDRSTVCGILDRE